MRRRRRRGTWPVDENASPKKWCSDPESTTAGERRLHEMGHLSLDSHGTKVEGDQGPARVCRNRALATI